MTTIKSWNRFLSGALAMATVIMQLKRKQKRRELWTPRKPKKTKTVRMTRVVAADNKAVRTTRRVSVRAARNDNFQTHFLKRGFGPASFLSCIKKERSQPWIRSFLIRFIFYFR
jgi:hypothetical protein